MQQALALAMKAMQAQSFLPPFFVGASSARHHVVSPALLVQASSELLSKTAEERAALLNDDSSLEIEGSSAEVFDQCDVAAHAIGDHLERVSVWCQKNLPQAYGLRCRLLALGRSGIGGNEIC